MASPRTSSPARNGGPARPAHGRNRRQHLAAGGYARGTETRHRIIQAAIDVFGSLGYQRASTRLIARRAAVSLPALRYYFGGKDGLHRACAERVSADFWSRLEPAMALLRNPDLSRAQLLHLLRSVQEAFLEWTVAERPASWSSFAVSESPPVALHRLVELIDEPMIGLLAEIISRILRLSTGHPHVRIRALGVLGQLELLRCARPIVLRALGWRDLRGGRLQTLKNALWSQTELGF